MEDIAPKLYEKIKNEFQSRFEKSKKIKALRKKIEKGESTYKDAGAFAIETGEILSDVFLNHFSSDTLPNGRLYYNIADRVVRPMLEEDYNLISDHAAEVQKILNRKAKIGIKSIKPELNQDKVQGIIDIVSGKDKFDDIAYMLRDPIVNFSQTIIDDTVRANADFQYKAGLNPEIIRISTGKCCKWCDKLAKTYKYEDVSDTGNEVFRRHERCRCIVEYDGKNGKIQNVHTKQWSKSKSSDKIKTKEKSEETPGEKEKRIKEENGLDFVSRIAEHPRILGSYTPESLYHNLKNQGYETKPLKGKNYRDIPFEKGGGYRVNFGGDGILMYHPGERSHHGGEYYKLSTGKGGTRRYDRKGNEIKKDRENK